MSEKAAYYYYPFPFVGVDALGNPIVLGCPFPWCRFEPGPLHKHSLILPEDRAAVPAPIGGHDVEMPFPWRREP